MMISRIKGDKASTCHEKVLLIKTATIGERPRPLVLERIEVRGGEIESRTVPHLIIQILTIANSKCLLPRKFPTNSQ